MVLRHGETVESSTLPENGNNPMSWLTQNEVGNKGEQLMTLQSVSGRITKERKREQRCGEEWRGVQRIESHLRECRRIRRSLELCSDEGEIRKMNICKITESTGSLEETSGM